MPLRHYNIPIFIPERACPFQCIYCNQQKITGAVDLVDFAEITTTIDDYLQSIPKENSEIQIAFFGGTFTAMPIEEQIEFLKIANIYISNNQVNGVRISTRPDNISQEILDVLKKYGVTHIELGAQSLDEDVLIKSHRGHDFESVKKASALIKKNDFVLGLQMMIGLPSDTLEKAKQTAQKIVELGAEETRIYPTLVIKDTALHHLLLKGKYTAISTTDAVSQSAEVYKIFHKNYVKVLRIGLYPDENLLENEVVAGPEMYNFKEKVLSHIWKEIFEKFIGDIPKNDSHKKKILISVAPKQVNAAIGYEASNRKTLSEIFYKVKFKENSSLNNFEYHVDYY